MSEGSDWKAGPLGAIIGWALVWTMTAALVAASVIAAETVTWP